MIKFMICISNVVSKALQTKIQANKVENNANYE